MLARVGCYIGFDCLVTCFSVMQGLFVFILFELLPDWAVLVVGCIWVCGFGYIIVLRLEG